MDAAEALNCLGQFCAAADLTFPFEKLPQEQADVMVLFGGSILAGADLFAQALQKKLARIFIICGGRGHTTAALEQAIEKEYPGFPAAGCSEAQMLNWYLQTRWNCQADYLETESTNCGNNITFLLKLLEDHQIPCRSIILCQDASMQRRMEAGLRKYAPQMNIVNCPAYQAEAIETSRGLQFRNPIHGMWSMEHYADLLMGEIVRLEDGPEGYGPAGKDFIAHVEIPDSVKKAFVFLKENSLAGVRQADPRFASPQKAFRKQPR